MEMRTWAQLRRQYGPDSYLVVSGSAGDMVLSTGLSESDAVELYKGRGGKPACIIVCVPTDRGRQCYRGWIDDERWKWVDGVGTASEGLAVEPKPKPRKKAKLAGRAYYVDSVEVTDADVVITDPCYILEDRSYDRLISNVGDGRIRPRRFASDDGMEMVFADTIYGDWMCRLEGKLGRKPHEFGRFTADAGLVCVAINLTAESANKLAKLPGHCYVRLSKFTGRVHIVHNGNTCWVSGEGKCCGEDATFRSRQIA